MKSWTARAAALSLMLTAGVALAQKGGGDGTVQYEKETPKPLSDADARRQQVNDVFSQIRSDGPTDRVVYGADDRKDVYQVTDPALLDIAQAACVVVSTSELVFNGDGTVTLLTSPWNDQFGTPVCNDEPFRGQDQIGFCSGFLVGTDLVVSAGHCIGPGDEGSVAFVFGFDQIDADTGPLTVVPEDDVYIVTQVVDHALAGELDHSLSRVDRPVLGYSPLPIRRVGEPNAGDQLVMVGHPTVLPKKIDDGAAVQDPRVGGGFFTGNLDAYGGNSGSLVFNMNAGVVEGILVRGNPDFDTSTGCARSNVCPNSGCPGFEEASKVITFANLVPPLGARVTPAGDTLSIGLVGGPFSNDPVVYTIDNPTSDPLDYHVEIVGNVPAPLLINGSTSPINGTLPGGGSFQVTASLDATATALGAGVYSSTIVFDDLTNNTTSSRTHTLEIGQTNFDVTPLDGLSTGGPVGGPFNATKAYTITSTRPTPVDVQIAGSASWISVDGMSSETITLSGTGDSAIVTVGFSSDANLLPAGIQFGTVDFTNMTGTAGDTSRDIALDVGRFSFPSNDTPIPIVDNSTLTSTITVPDAICIGDVDVVMDISHTFIGDLEVDLTSPTGTTVRLHDRTGGGDDNIMVTYDDSSFPPDGPGTLADFNDTVATGDWTLTVTDNAGLDEGTLNSWTLKIAASAGACPPSAQDGFVNVPHTVTSPITLQGASSNGSFDFVIQSLPANGSLSDPGAGPIVSTPYTLAANGDTVNYTPNAGYIGNDSFTFNTFDGASSTTATEDILVGIVEVIHDFPLDSSPGWTTEGLWEFGAPAGGGSHNFDPIAGFTGSNVYGYDLLGDYANNLPETRLTTGALDMTGIVNAHLSFARWLAIESSTFDHASVEVSNDGTSWTLVWEHTDLSVSPTSWTLVDYDISAIADNQPTVFVRWTMGTTDGSVTYPGWNIDDIQLTGIRPPAACAPDLTGSLDPNDPGFGVPDGILDANDFFFYLGLFGAGDPAADLTGSIDPNDPTFGIPDGTLDANDFFFYLQLFAQGCP